MAAPVELLLLCALALLERLLFGGAALPGAGGFGDADKAWHVQRLAGEPWPERNRDKRLPDMFHHLASLLQHAGEQRVVGGTVANGRSPPVLIAEQRYRGMRQRTRLGPQRMQWPVRIPEHIAHIRRQTPLRAWLSWEEAVCCRLGPLPGEE